MTDWTAGYVADIGYTFGYYTELNPARVKLAFLNAGLVYPEFGAACELGFGQGLSTNMHAAASITQWSGTDFNPSQAGYAQELASQSDSGARLFDQAFDEFAQRSDLPDFDYIGLHGIWSWISDANRAVIVDFVRRKLKVGGVLYISYNTQPGWASFAPMRHLLTEHAQNLGASGSGIVPRIDAALDFASKLLATQPQYAKANPAVEGRLKSLQGQNRQYLAHEYFNRDWHPMHFASMVDWLEPAKVTFACSAHYLDHIENVNLTGEQQALLKDIPDANFRETVRDYMVNQQFRRDYWVKGARKLSAVERSELLRQQKIILVSPRVDISLKISAPVGEATMQESVYVPVLDLLANHQAQTIGQLELALSAQGIQPTQVIQAIMVLAGSGHICLVQDDAVIAQVLTQTQKLNAHLMAKAKSSSDVAYLTSPVIGGGYAVGRFQQLFLLAIQQGHQQPTEWARYVWDILVVQGQKIIKEGYMLQSDEANMAELTEQALAFAAKQLPILKALQMT
jgi:SAM-dependent methyltransferase